MKWEQAVRSCLGLAQRLAREATIWPHMRCLAANRALRGLHQGRCFVLGSGPSLAHQDLSHLATETVFGLNTSYLHPEVPRMARKYWVTVDLFYMEPSQFVLTALREMESRVGDATYIFPLRGKALCERHGLFAGRRVHYVHLKHILSPWFQGGARRFAMDRALPRPVGVSETAIACAAYMGFSSVYLLGMDSDWFAHLGEGNRYFYSEEENPFAIDSRIKNWIDHSSQESKLKYAHLLFRSYRLLRDLLAAEGTRVYNATGGGLLDVFPWVDYAALFNGSGAPSPEAP